MEHRPRVPASTRQKTLVGVALTDHCRRLKITQSELARRAYLDHSSVSRYISGERYPTPDAVRFMAEALEVPYADLCREIGRTDYIGPEYDEHVFAALSAAKHTLREAMASVDYALGLVRKPASEEPEVMND